MKQLKTLFATTCLLLSLAACREELPEAATIEPGKESISFTTASASASVNIETSHAWSATASDAWLTVSPASGGPGTSELTLSAAANTTTTARKATVLIQVGHTQASIEVVQDQKDVLGLDRTSETVAWPAGTLNLTVSANVTGYRVSSDATWLRESPLRSVEDSTLLFVYDENPTYDARTTKVTVRRGDLSSVLTVTQGGKGALYFVLEQAEVPASDTRYALKLMKNTPVSGLKVTAGADWVTLPSGTRAAPAEETVMLTLTPNKTTTPREARLVISYNSDGVMLTDAFTLTQLGMELMIRPEQSAYTVKAEGATLTVPVEASGKFNVVVPEAAAVWLTAPEGDQLPGSLQFTIAENKKSTVRTAEVVLLLQEGDDIKATVTISQEAADLPAMDRIPKMYNLPEISTVIETDPVNLGAFKATVSYDDGDDKNWLTEIYTNNGKLHFVVGDNTGTSTKRSATLRIVPEEGDAVEIRVNQSGTDEAYIELEKSGTLASFIDLSREDAYKKIRLVSATGINESDLNTLRSAALGAEEADLSGVKLMPTFPAGAFKGSTTLRQIELPENMTVIGASAFDGCTALEVVDFPAGLETIGDKAFAGAFTSSTLSTLDFSEANALATIGANAFEGCNTLTKLVLPGDKGKLTAIGNAAFKECYSLGNEDLLLPSTLVSIGSEAFYNCKSLTGTLVLKAALTTIGAKAFMKCAALQSLDMSASKLGAIEEETFKECKALFAGDDPAPSALKLPATVKAIAAGAFENTGILSVELPKDLAEIGRRAFYNCIRLSTVTCHKAGTPPTLDATSPGETFGGNTPQGQRTLYVPTAAVTTYKADPSWKKATPDNGWDIEPIASN